MIKVGFIDYYLDEWHANNYPKMISEFSGGKMEVYCAYGMIDSPNEDGMTNAEWSKQYGVPLRDTIEEVVNECDVLVVLSPDHPDMHPQLCDIPLRSGKRVYIDKTFATDGATARAIFDIAEAHNTPCFSSSALRFADELKDIDRSDIKKIYCEGPGLFDQYSIHQIEQIVALMDTPAEKVMFTGEEAHPSMIISFKDGRLAQMYQRRDPAFSFRTSVVNSDNHAAVLQIRSDFFRLFVEELIRFFETGEVKVPHSQTVDVIAIRAAGLRAMKKPFVWENI